MEIENESGSVRKSEWEEEHREIEKRESGRKSERLRR